MLVNFEGSGANSEVREGAAIHFLQFGAKSDPGKSPQKVIIEGLCFIVIPDSGLGFVFRMFGIFVVDLFSGCLGDLLKVVKFADRRFRRFWVESQEL